MIRKQAETTHQNYDPISKKISIAQHVFSLLVLNESMEVIKE